MTWKMTISGKTTNKAGGPISKGGGMGVKHDEVNQMGLCCGRGNPAAPLGCLHVLAILNKAAINLSMLVFCGHNFLTDLGKYQRMWFD